MKKKPKPRLRVPALERLKEQIEQLEWLLSESGYDPAGWEAVATSDEDVDGIVLGLSLTPKGLRAIRLSSVPDPKIDWLGRDRHFWIDGNHWYDEHAAGTLRELFIEQPEDEDEDEDE